MKNKKRIIEIEVNDEYIVGSGVVIGAAGSHNDVIMKVRFNSSWAGLNIIATFRDALGENPISVVLTAVSTLVADESDSDHDVHKFSVPLKAKAYEGKISLSFTGYTVAAVASEDGEGVEYQETQAITSGAAYFNVLKSDAMLANDVFENANVGEQLHDGVNKLRKMYSGLDGALGALKELLDQFKKPSFTMLDLSEVQNAIEDINDFLKYEHENEDELGKENIFNRVYPVGSIYMSMIGTSPASLFGGTWTQLQSQFLLAANNTASANADPKYNNNESGGEEMHTLTQAEMPTHNHIQRTSPKTWGWARTALIFTASASSSATGADTPLGNSEYGTYSNRTYLYTETNGGDGSHNNMPPYLAVYMWKRTA